MYSLGLFVFHSYTCDVLKICYNQKKILLEPSCNLNRNFASQKIVISPKCVADLQWQFAIYFYVVFKSLFHTLNYFS